MSADSGATQFLRRDDTLAQLDHEVGIAWARDDALELDYVRSSIARTRTREGPPPRHHGDHLVGWATLHPDTPHHEPPAYIHYRRYFWLRDSDRPLDSDGAFAEQAPAEAVDPRTVEAGRAGRLTARAAWGDR